MTREQLIELATQLGEDAHTATITPNPAMPPGPPCFLAPPVEHQDKRTHWIMEADGRPAVWEWTIGKWFIPGICELIAPDDADNLRGCRYIKPAILEVSPNPANDSGGKEADYHGPKDTSDPAYPAHKAAHEAAEHLINGRVTNPGARKVLRDALDVADKPASGREKGDDAISSGRALRLGAVPLVR